MGKKEKTTKIPGAGAAKRYVVQGATLKCSCGDRTSKLQTPGRKNVRIHNKLQANIMDFKPMSNIQPFGKCCSLANPTVAAATAANKGRLKKMPCAPNTTLPWLNGKNDKMVDGAPALLESSTNMCLYSGKISITDAGQIESSQSKKSGRVEAGVDKMANGGMMFMVGMGALLVGATVLAAVTAPVSLPVLAVAASTGLAVSTVATAGTVAAVGTMAVGGVTMAMGTADSIEGGQDVAFGAAGSNRRSVNFLRDTVFSGNSEAYNNAEMIASTTAMVAAMALEPFMKMEVKTSSTKLRSGKSNPVKMIRNKGNCKFSQKVRRRTGNVYRRKRCLRDPVDAIAGEVILDRQDFTLPGRIAIQWERHYGSQSTYIGLCGRGWETPGDIRLEFLEDGTVLFHDGSGSPSCFDALPVSTPVVEPIDGRLLQRQEGYYTVRYQEGLTYYFPISKETTKLFLVGRISDSFGNTIQYLRDANGLLEIRESNGRRIEVMSQQGRIESMHLCHPGQTPQLLVKYSYDEHSNLTAAYDALDVPYRFEYRDNLLIQHTNRNGLSFHYEYDQYTQEGRCIHTWGDGGLYEGWFVYHDDHKTVEAIGSLGTITFLYDDCYRILQETNPLGGVTKYDYDEYGRTIAVVNPDGHRTEYAYDQRGNLLKLTRPDGKTIKTEYDAIGKPLRITDPNGVVWKQEWDLQDQLSKRISPSGATSQYRYDEYGQLSDYIDPLGNNTKLAFDNYGNLVSLADAHGNITEFTYDALGRTAARIDPAKRRYSYQYDLKGRLVKAVLPGGNTVTCEYDAEDNLIAYKDESGAVTRLEYCGVNELKRRIQPDGQTVEYEYNAEEQLTAVINQRGERYELKRDAEGRIVAEIDYWGQSRKYSYSAAGYLKESIDPLGRIIRYQTDPLGRIVAKVLSELEGTATGQSETFKYDANGNLIACANREIEIKRFFDLEGKLVKEEQGTDFCITYSYDLNGNRTSRITTIQNGAAAKTQTINYAYDSLGRATGIELGGQQPINFNRNRLGQITHENLGNSLKRWFEYDEAGYLIGQGVASGVGPLFKQEYGYDQAGNLVGKRDSVFGTDRFYYDQIGRITRQIDPVGQARQYLYDQAGDRLTTAINMAQPDDPKSQWARAGVCQDLNYQFDRAGNLVKRTGRQETAAFIWDANGRLVKSVSGGQTTIYCYDALGRRVSKETAGVTTRFYWDGDALVGELRLEAKGSAQGGGKTGADAGAGPTSDLVCIRVREWVYYPGGFEPLAMVETDGLASDALTGAVATTDTDKITNGRIYYYANGPNGCPTRLLDEDGKVVWAALYDVWGKVKKLPVDEVEQPLRLQGQFYDEETGLYYTRFRYYCPEIGSFISKDPLGLAAGENVYAFGPNVQKWIDPLGLSCDKLKSIPKDKPVVVVGESMSRVNKVADSLKGRGYDVKTYQPRNFRSFTPTSPGLNSLDLEANRSWLGYWAKTKNATFVDIGLDNARTLPRSPFYQMENRSLYSNWKNVNVVQYDPGF